MYQRGRFGGHYRGAAVEAGPAPLAVWEAPMNKVWAIAAAALTLTAGGLVSPGAASAAVAEPIVVNFTNDAGGGHPNGFHSVGAPNVFFYDTMGADLYVGDFAAMSHGNGLLLNDVDGAAIEIRLASPTNAISLAFGNDNSSTDPTDQAELKVYRGTTLVSQVDVSVNANSAMDQTIGVSGQGLFNRATFRYVDSLGAGKMVGQIIDDVTVSPLCTITGTPGNNHLVGTPGNDVICGDAGHDTIRGGGGADLIYGGSGGDTVRGGKGKDVLVGSSGKDHLIGGKGRDHLSGGSGKDRLSGGKGRDVLLGGTARDN
jgi:Ca2+-binding RTX toxin-like protein